MAAAFTISELATGPGENACSSFEGCTYDGSPVIAKHRFDDGVPSAVETSSGSPSIDGIEFAITFDAGSAKKGSWSGMPTGCDPLIVTAFAIKDGSGGAVLFKWNPSSGTDVSIVSGDTSLNGTGDKAISNIASWDMGSSLPSRVPASALPLPTSFGGLAMLRRRSASPRIA